ncbi:crossover junction endodeoxyribonuclease RuvC [Patescibacteria group bacterium]
MKPKIKNLNVLGVDPGLATTGYAFVKETKPEFTVLEYGTISTPAKMDFSERLKNIHQDLDLLIKKLKPDVIVVENIYFAKNAKTALQVGQARGVILLTAILHKLPLYEFTPLQVKLAVCGYGQADKCQVQKMVKNILKLKEIPKPDDAADAIAIALTYLQSKNYINKAQ